MALVSVLRDRVDGLLRLLLHLLLQEKLLELGGEVVLASWGESSSKKFLRLPRLLESMNNF